MQWDHGAEIRRRCNDSPLERRSSPPSGKPSVLMLFFVLELGHLFVAQDLGVLLLRRLEVRPPGAVGADGKERQQLLEILSLTGGTGGRARGSHKGLEPMSAASTLVIVKRHGQSSSAPGRALAPVRTLPDQLSSAARGAQGRSGLTTCCPGWPPVERGVFSAAREGWKRHPDALLIGFDKSFRSSLGSFPARRHKDCGRTSSRTALKECLRCAHQ